MNDRVSYSKRGGHSNVLLDELDKTTFAPKCRIQICGGADVSTVRRLPALALSEEEWRVIGRYMNWNLPKGVNT